MYGNPWRKSAWALTALALACLACTSSDSGSADADTAPGDTAVAAEETTTPSADASAGAVQSEQVDAPLTAADIERWERGQRAELEAVDKELAKLKSAKSATDTLSVQMSVTEQSTVEAGVRAAGVSESRYRRIDAMIGQVLSARMMSEATQKDRAKAAMDTANMTPEVRARVRESLAQMDSAWGDPFKDLPSDAAAALRPRAAQLDTLRWTLIAARMGKTLKGDPKP